MALGSRSTVPLLYPIFALLLAAAPGCSGRPARTHDDAAIRVEPAKPRTPEGPAIEYTLRFPSPSSHMVDVEMMIPVPASGADLELMMPVWTPGSYMVREFSRQIESIQAASAGGDVLSVDKVRKNRWRIKPLGADRITVRYRVYANELSCRTSYVTDQIAILNPSSVLLTVAGELARPHDVAVELPPGYKRLVTSLPPHPAGGEHRYLAGSYDELVNSPIVAGDPVVAEIAIEGVPHVLATFRGDPMFDHASARRDVEILMRAIAKFWGVIPYSRYVILNVLLDGGGGLEHLESTLLTVHPWRGTRDAYVDWLRLVAHEHFHAWNVKRLRPVELGPFDYENEVYTRSLWVAEGLTSYYELLFLARTGFYDQALYLEKLSDDIATVQTSPGRLVHALSAASYDAWIKFYRRDENFTNTSVSYYEKGTVVGFLLDAEIRRATRGSRSLDDVMRLAYQRYSGERGYTPDEFRQVAEEVAGRSLAELWARAIDGTAELDYTAALAYFGLEFTPAEPPKPGDQSLPAGWLGATTADRGDNVRITQVPRDTPAAAAGLSAGDELIAINDRRVDGGKLDEQLSNYRPGTKVRVTVARDDQLQTIEATLGEKPTKTWKLRPLERISARQKRDLDAWLQIPATPNGSSPIDAGVASDAAR